MIKFKYNLFKHFYFVFIIDIVCSSCFFYFQDCFSLFITVLKSPQTSKIVPIKHNPFILYLYLKMLKKYPFRTDTDTNKVKTPVCLLIVTAPIKKKLATVVGIPHMMIAINILLI